MNDSDDNKTMLSDSDAPEPTHADGDESYCAACGGSYPFTIDVCPKDGARLTKLKAQPDALLGRVFDGRFEVRTSLGHGGMGTVYRGWQITVDREIAIKVIHPKLASDRIAVKRFLREARLSSRLNQPNIVNVYDFGQTEDGILYIAMELVRGHTLGRELEAMRPMPLKRIMNIALQLCDALDSAHGQGIVHRDLKPNNIIILDDPPGRDLIKVLDFGLAKSLVTDTSSLVTNTNAILGTPLYMPPEQIEGKPSDQRADIYSLGCILYQMVSGRPPFVGDNVNTVLAAHVSDEPPPIPPHVPPVLARTIERMLEKDPSKRMTSAREAREQIQAVVESGYQSYDVNDTTPDVRPSGRGESSAERLRMVDTGPAALAVTDPAGAMRPSPVRIARPAVDKSKPTDGGVGVSSTGAGALAAADGSTSARSTTSRSFLRVAAPLALVAMLGGGAVYVVTRDDGTRAKSNVVAPPNPTPSNATPANVAPAIDAALPVAADAAIEIDALPVTEHIDAGAKSEPPKPKPPKPRPPKPNTGSSTQPPPTQPPPTQPPPTQPKPTQGSGTADIDFIPMDKPKPKN